MDAVVETTVEAMIADALSVDSDAATRLIVGRGTDEHAWRSSSPIDNMPIVDLAAWERRYPRIWIVSPHPDDEVLALGATMARLSSLGADLRIVSVTAGTASHPGSDRWTVERLAHTRPIELRRALDTLDIDASLCELGISDGEVARHEDAIERYLVQQVLEDDLILSPWRWDGHPDHEAAAAATARAAKRIGVEVVEYPVWMWHWATPKHDLIPWTRARCIRLDAKERNAKRAAIDLFVSQITPDANRPAILPPHVIERFTRPFEVFFC